MKKKIGVWLAIVGIFSGWIVLAIYGAVTKQRMAQLNARITSLESEKSSVSFMAEDLAVSVDQALEILQKVQAKLGQMKKTVKAIEQ